jgi:NADH-quinone oxidoreductase subunit M
MILTGLFLSLMLGGMLALLAGRWSATWPRWIALITLLLHLAAVVAIWLQNLGQVALAPTGPWLYEVNVPWIPQLGISYHLAMDGLSLLLVLLTSFLGIMAVATSWRGVEYRVGFFHFNLMWILGAIAGAFLARDLFLFYFFWEMMLVPLYFLIGIWGHENRVYATLKFFIFTQASSLLMLLSIIGLGFVHLQNTGTFTFDYTQLLGTSVPANLAIPLMLGFFIAFAVKLPAFPVHTWLPDAHTEAPTAGSVVLAGLVLKVGAYGFFRFVVPLFPQASAAIAPFAMTVAVIGILYGGIVAFSQTDLKRLVAYTSVSHMGFVLLGVFAWNELALQGALMVILTHGLSTGGLFILAGALQDRMHTRDLNRMGGLWSTMPRMGGVAMVLAAATLGLPGLGNFIGEILVLMGAYQANVTLAVLATLGFIVSTVYSLWMMQRVFFGPRTEERAWPDLSGREMAIAAALIAALVWLGLYPQPVLRTAQPSLEALREVAAQGQQAAAPAAPRAAAHDIGNRTAWPDLPENWGLSPAEVQEIIGSAPSQLPGVRP